jgi:hypothetical protein
LKRTLELDAQRLKMVILTHAQRHDLDTEAVVLALAETLGLTAAVLDRQVGHLPFKTRMESFTERAKAVYERTTSAQARILVGNAVRSALRG